MISTRHTRHTRYLVAIVAWSWADIWIYDPFGWKAALADRGCLQALALAQGVRTRDAVQGDLCLLYLSN